MKTGTLASIISKTLRILNLVLVNGAVFVLAFLVLEFGARTYSFLKSGRQFFRPNTFISPWITTYDYPPPMIGHDNQLYFRHRDKPSPREKPANTMRIIAVGGSTTICLAPYRATGIDYPLALERRLDGRFGGVRIEVLNAGADAYSTAQSLINIQFRLVEMSPDIILLMENINDSSVNYFGSGATPDYSNKYLQSYFLNPRLQATMSVAGFLTQSRLLAKFGLPQILANKRGDIHPENDFAYGLHLFSRNLVNIADVCKRAGIRLVLLSQPSSERVDPFVSESAFIAYNKAIAKTASEQRVEFIDMYSLMGHDNQYFLDKVHYNTAGVELFAKTLAPQLTPIIGDLLESPNGVESDLQGATANENP